MVNNIFLPTIFGPGFWTMAHLLSRRMGNSIYLLTFLKIYFTHITCQECQSNANRHLLSHPIEEATSLEDYVLEFHNHANRATNKPEWSKEKAIAALEKNIQDQSKMGPGVWIMIHIGCYHSQCTFEKLSMLKVIDAIIEELEGWRLSREYRHHREELVKCCSPDSGKKDLFEWSVNFHNAVNRKLGKEILPVEEVRSYYAEVCKECTL